MDKVLVGGQLHTPESLLEMLVDTTDVVAVLAMLSTVCLEKADHLRDAWQDKAAAKSWEHDAKVIERAALRCING